MEKAGMGQAGISGPYAVQIGKLADSLEHLSKVFLKLERQKQVFTKMNCRKCFFRWRRVSVQNVIIWSGVGERTMSILTSWDMKFCMPSRNMGKN